MDDVVGGIVMIVVGIVVAVMAFAARAERLYLNNAIGLRLPALMVSDEGWAKGHKAAWVWILLAGVGICVSGVASMLDFGQQLAWVLGGVGWAVVMLIVACVVAVRAANAVNAADRRSSEQS